MDTSMYETDDKTQRRRVIVVATLIGLVVLSIAAWAIVAIANNDQGLKNAATKQEVAVDDGANKEAPKTEGVSTEVAGTASEQTEAEKQEQAAKQQEEAAKQQQEQAAKQREEAAKKQEEIAKQQEQAASSSSANTNKTIAAQDTVPATGPEELLPLALVAGLAATYFASRKFAKRA